MFNHREQEKQHIYSEY